MTLKRGTSVIKKILSFSGRLTSAHDHVTCCKGTTVSLRLPQHGIDNYKNA